MFLFNSKRVTFYVGLCSLLITLYSIHFDLIFLNIPYSHSFFVFKAFIAFTSVFLLCILRDHFLDMRVFAYGIIFSTYVIYFIYEYSINYMIGSIQLLFVFTGVLYLDLIYFLIFYFYLCAGTYLAMYYSKGLYGFNNLDKYYRDMYIDDFLSLQIISGIVYALVAYPRIRQIKQDLSFSNFGKASSFILHEIQKPIAKMRSNDLDNQEIDQVYKTLELAKKIQQNSLDNYEIISIDLHQFIEAINERYLDYIQFFNIKITNTISNTSIRSNTEMLHLIIENLIKNAIEANKEINENERYIEISFTDDNLQIKNPFKHMIPKNEIFTPSKSSKNGNMGLGLYFCKMISNNLGHQLTINSKNNIFESNLNFQGKKIENSINR